MCYCSLSHWTMRSLLHDFLILMGILSCFERTTFLSIELQNLALVYTLLYRRLSLNIDIPVNYYNKTQADVMLVIANCNDVDDDWMKYDYKLPGLVSYIVRWIACSTIPISHQLTRTNIIINLSIMKPCLR